MRTLTMKPRKQPKKPRKADVKAAADRAEKRARGEEIEIAKVDIDPVIASAEEIKTKMGRPPKYKPEFARIASALCKRGATDMELAEEFQVNTTTIWRWTCQYDDFCNAVRIAKDSYDDRVERALAQRAVGYSFNTEKVFNFQGGIVRARVVEHVPPDIAAAKLWLMNRRPDRWKDVQKHEHGNPGDFDGMSQAELDAYIEAESEALRKPRGSGKAKPKSA